MPPVPPSLQARTSPRRLAVVGLGLAVAVVLCGAVASAPGAAAGPTAVARTPVTADVTTVAARAASVDDLPPPVGRPTVGARPSSPPPATVPSPGPRGPAITALAAQGIPVVALEAYRRAAAVEATARPSCHLGWTLVAAIGAVESGHGTHAGARLYADGQDLPHVLGPVLDGTAGNARIPDTDHGVLDGDRVYDRAVGPMQFIPSTWELRGRDGNGDGRADPFNIVDAAVTTGDYLCRYDVDLGTDAGRRVAVFGYDHVDSYVTAVLALDAIYAHRPVVTTSASPPAAPPSSTPVAPAPKPTPTPSRTTSPPPTPDPTPTCPTATPSGSPSGTPSAGPTPTTSDCSTAPGPSTSAPPPATSPSVLPSAAASPSAVPTPTRTPTG